MNKMNCEEKKDDCNLSPKIKANFLSRLTFWWLRELFSKGRKKNLRAEDLYEVLPENVSGKLGDKLEIYWEEELIAAKKKDRDPSLWRAIIRTFGWSFIKYGISILILNMVKILQPFVLALLIWHFNPLSNSTITEAYIYASCLIGVTVLQTMIVRHAHLGQSEIGMRIRIACSSLIYRKVLKLSSTSSNPRIGGMIINLLSNDLSKFEKFVLHLHYVWIMPFIMTLITYLIWRELGIAALAGIIFMTVQIIPTQVCWYRMTSSLRSKGAVRTDKRVLLIGEIINGISVIKMYAWEKFFEQLVFLARKYEVDAILKRCQVKSVSLAFAIFTHRAALFFTIFVYVSLENTLSAEKVFSTIGYFTLVRLIMARFFPEAVFLGAEVNVSIKRIEEFLLLEEMDPVPEKTKINTNNVILVKEVSASWDITSNTDHLQKINIEVQAKKLLAVVGPVGSGKSSLLKVLLGELKPHTGQVYINGRVSYASQEPWLFSGSVRDNILFGEPYDEVKYNQVVKVCCLDEDFEQLPYDDKTLVGERGAALSGGQCARVNLARAVYRDADVYLLDDPLSAVDGHVAHSLFQQCIDGFLKDKTRILVTHQVQFLEKADTIIVINNGRIDFQGTYKDFISNEQYIKLLPVNNQSQKALVENEKILNSTNSIPAVIAKRDREEREPKETEELLAKGKFSKALYWKYISASSSYFTLFLLLLSFVLTQLSISGFDYWLAYWTKQEEKRLKYKPATNSSNTTSVLNNIPDEYLDNDTGLLICGILVTSIVISSIVRNLLFYKKTVDSSKKIHNKMFARLIRAPMYFFYVNPSGRIVNRFSKDTGAADELLPNAMLDVIERMFLTTGIIVQILIINWWAVGPFVITSYLFMKINDVYLSTAQAVKRLEGNAKSPVFSLVNSTLLGLPTIRSSEAQKLIGKEFDTRQDLHTSAHHLYLVASSAFGFWLDLVSTIFLAALAYSFIILNDSETFAGDVGLALTQALSVCGTLQFTIKQVAEVMGQMISVERMFQVTELDQEGPFDSLPGTAIEKDWPARGEVRFKEIYLRYADEETPVLKNVDFLVDAGMKVGIVGRTGAGKSSLIAALFRLAKYDGTLLIDNIDSKTVGLLDLRNKISIIPQEPILFTATLRDNLDPLRQHDDASLWSALEEVDLHKNFESLDHVIERGGSNFSTGQRQLLCLARAILKKNKILVMDEATANVDQATDDVIQKTIRIKFKDCTVLTIAHRLNTIMDSDKVLVMDSGEVVEYDEPKVLMKKSDGYFYSMVMQSGNTHMQDSRKKC